MHFYDGRDIEKKRAKGTKKCIVKKDIKFKNYTDSLFNDEIIIKRNKDLEVIVIEFVQKKLIG